MIPMSDSDVQDVRDVVATQTAEYERKQQLLHQMKILTERPMADEEVPILMHVARQEKDRLERERRLGIEPVGQTHVGIDSSVSAHSQPGPSVTVTDRRMNVLNFPRMGTTGYGTNQLPPPGP